MKTSKNLLVGLFALLTVTAGGVAWQQYWRAARLEASLLGHDDSTELQKRLAETERRNRALELELEARREPLGETTAEGPGRGPRGDLRALLDRPEMQRLRALQQKAALDSRFAPLFKALNLPAEKIEQLKTLLAERESTMQDVMMAARDQGLDPRSDPDGFLKLAAAAQTEINSQLKTLLGDEGFAHYEQYAQTQPQRATVEQLRQSLSYTSEPLSDTQAAQLVQILAATAPASANNAVPMPPPDGGRGGRGPGGGGGGVATAPITAAAVVPHRPDRAHHDASPGAPANAIAPASPAAGDAGDAGQRRRARPGLNALPSRVAGSSSKPRLQPEGLG
jgi:hypothetical protein